jgi:hypothetical protein
MRMPHWLAVLWRDRLLPVCLLQVGCQPRFGGAGRRRAGRAVEPGHQRGVQPAGGEGCWCCCWGAAAAAGVLLLLLGCCCCCWGAAAAAAAGVLLLLLLLGCCCCCCCWAASGAGFSGLAAPLPRCSHPAAALTPIPTSPTCPQVVLPLLRSVLADPELSHTLATSQLDAQAIADITQSLQQHADGACECPRASSRAEPRGPRTGTAPGLAAARLPASAWLLCRLPCQMFLHGTTHLPACLLSPRPRTRPCRSRGRCAADRGAAGGAGRRLRRGCCRRQAPAAGRLCAHDARLPGRLQRRHHQRQGLRGSLCCCCWRRCLRRWRWACCCWACQQHQACWQPRSSHLNGQGRQHEPAAGPSCSGRGSDRVLSLPPGPLQLGTTGDGSEVQALVADSLSILHKFAESYQPGGCSSACWAGWAEAGGSEPGQAPALPPSCAPRRTPSASSRCWRCMSAPTSRPPPTCHPSSPAGTELAAVMDEARVMGRAVAPDGAALSVRQLSDVVAAAAALVAPLSSKYNYQQSRQLQVRRARQAVRGWGGVVQRPAWSCQLAIGTSAARPSALGKGRVPAASGSTESPTGRRCTSCVCAMPQPANCPTNHIHRHHHHPLAAGGAQALPGRRGGDRHAGRRAAHLGHPQPAHAQRAEGVAGALQLGRQPDVAPHSLDNHQHRRAARSTARHTSHTSPPHTPHPCSTLLLHNY